MKLPESDTQSIIKELDATGLSCPLPVLRAHKILKTMQAGEKLRVLSTDAASKTEIPAFCQQVEFSLEKSFHDNGIYTFIIIK